MNVSSQPLVLPINQHRRRFLTTTHSSMAIDACPVAVSNKIKAIQARKTRLNSLPAESGYTDIRPLNFGYTGGVTNSKANVTVWTAERLVDRSKSIRLDRIPTRQPSRPSVLSTTNTTQQSLLWPNYQSSTLGHKKLQIHSNSTTITPPAIGSIRKKSAGIKMPEIPRRQNRQPLIDRQNSFTPVEPQQKSLETTINNNLPTYETEQEQDEEEEILIDQEFEQYLDKAIIKCADWLIKYVFKETDN